MTEATPPLDLAALSSLLGQIAPHRTVPEVMGTLTALVTSPTAVHPSRWLLWIIEDARFDTESDARAFLNQVLVAYRALDAHLQLGEPVGPDPEDSLAVRQWAGGYFHTARRDPIWSADTRAMRRLMPLALLSGELARVGEPDSVMHSAAMRAKWTRGIPALAAAFYEHWQVQRDANRPPAPPDQDLDPETELEH